VCPVGGKPADIAAAAREFEFVEIHRVVDAASRFARFGVLKKP